MASSASADLNTVVQTALVEFTTALSGHEFATFLNQLQRVITTEKGNHDAAAADRAVAALRDASKRPTSQGSKQMTIKEVNEFIKQKHDAAIFLVTGGSFNPPHNGHIRMFETAYKKLMEDAKNTDKKVYGVMVPAPNTHIEDKLCKEALHTDTCSDPNSQEVKKATETKLIDLPNRVKLCTLSCDSFQWGKPGNFGPQNMIVVNEADNDPGAKIVSKSPANTYYLCGSDYYAKAKDSGYMFIFITRNGDNISARSHNRFTLKGSNDVINAKAGDIMIVGNEDDDSEASSSRLRDILEKLKDADINIDDAIIETLNVPIASNLLTNEVYCELLKTGYIVGQEKGGQYEEFMNCSKSTPSSGNDTDDLLKDVDGIRHNGPRSLCNIGNMCYMNAALQLIYSMPEFSQAIRSINNPLTRYLKAMENGVDCSSAVILASELHKFAKTHQFADNREIKNQEDPNELIMTIFADTIFDNYRDSMTFTTSQATVYTGVGTIDSKCKSLDNTVLKKINTSEHNHLLVLPKERDEKEKEKTLELPIALDNDNGIVLLDTFAKVFEAYTAPADIDEKVDDSNSLDNLYSSNGIIFNLPDGMMKTDAQGKVTTPKQLKDECKSLVKVVQKKNTNDKPFRLNDIKSKSYIFPRDTQRYFIVVLKRTITDGFDQNNQMKYKKLKHSVSLNDAHIKIDDHEFIIKGCICHHGEGPNSGHYTYVAFENGKPYMVYDDTHICPYDIYTRNVGRTVDVTGYVLLFERKPKP